MSYEVHLDVYEGPFQLILGLISDRRLDVCDLSIARLTEDYIAHLDRMREMDLEVTTEFLVVAATLLQLKARALLPTPPGEEPPDEDALERDLLIARLLEVRTFQAAGMLLADHLTAGDRRYPAAHASDDPVLRVLPTLAGIAAEDLARALVDRIRDQIQVVDVSLVISDEISTQDAVIDILERLGGGTATFRQIVAGRGTVWAVSLFLAMLELTLRGEISLGQGQRFGEIELTLRAQPAGAQS